MRGTQSTTVFHIEIECYKLIRKGCMESNTPRKIYKISAHQREVLELQNITACVKLWKLLTERPMLDKVFHYVFVLHICRVGRTYMFQRLASTLPKRIHRSVLWYMNLRVRAKDKKYIRQFLLQFKCGRNLVIPSIQFPFLPFNVRIYYLNTSIFRKKTLFPRCPCRWM